MGHYMWCSPALYVCSFPILPPREHCRSEKVRSVSLKKKKKKDLTGVKSESEVKHPSRAVVTTCQSSSLKGLHSWLDRLQQHSSDNDSVSKRQTHMHTCGNNPLRNAGWKRSQRNGWGEVLEGEVSEGDFFLLYIWYRPLQLFIQWARVCRAGKKRLTTERRA